MRYTRVSAAERTSGLGDDVSTKFHNDAADWCAVGSNVEENLGIAAVARRLATVTLRSIPTSVNTARARAQHTHAIVVGKRPKRPATRTSSTKFDEWMLNFGYAVGTCTDTQSRQVLYPSRSTIIAAHQNY